MTGKIEAIKFKGKTVDNGYIIDYRKYKWTLKKKYQPCWAKNGTFISELSPQKKDFAVYIPAKRLKGKITIQNINKRIVIEVISKTKSNFEYNIIEEKQCQENKKPSTLELKPDPEVPF
jgi:hypothetical protein